MAYQNNSAPTYNKGAVGSKYPPRAAAPVRAPAAGGDKVQPVSNLVRAIPSTEEGGKSKYEKITGLFANKIGMSIKVNQDLLDRLSALRIGDVLCIFPNDGGPKK